MADVLALVFPFFGLIGLGVVVARLRPIPLEGMAWLNTFIVYVALPPLFFNLLSQTPVEDLTNWAFVIATLLGTLLTFLLVFVPTLLAARGDPAEPTVKGLAGAYGNIGYMGPGLALLALGPAAGVPVAIVFCFDNALHFTVAPLMMALSRSVSGDARQSMLRVVWGVVRSILTHPFIVATIVGVLAAIYEWQPPEAVGRMVDLLAAAAAPCALFAMGVTLALRPVRTFPPALLAIVPVKLIVHPLIVLGMLTWFGPFDATWVQAAVLLAALPCATNVYVIAQQYDVWVNRASASVLVTTLLSVLTVTALLYGVQRGWLDGIVAEPPAAKQGRLSPVEGLE